MWQKRSEFAAFELGYHVYKEILEAAAGEVPVCEREPHNGALDRTRCLPMPFSLVTLSELLVRTDR